MTYKELTDGIRAEIFVSGEEENLVTAHDNFFLQALYDLQVSCQCYQSKNNTRFAHCSTFFNCGMTVIPKPDGKIVRVYAIDRLNPDTGEEDPTAQEEWCAKVHYHAVSFDSIESYVKLAQRCSNSASALDSLASLFFGVYRNKRRYPRPTDEGLEGRAVLPEGYHYPQASTDASGRSPYGVYAIYRGRLYVAPWIQSSETLVVEHAGIKRKFNAEDVVEDDPKFRQAVSLHVQHQHESRWGDPAKATEFFNQLRGPIGAIPILVHQCQQESTPQRAGSQGFGWERGMGAIDTLSFENDTAASYTARCPLGQTGGPITVTKAVGSITSPFSVQDANARAVAAAQTEATAQLACVTPPVVYYNTAQTATASCPGPDETSGTPAAVGSTITIQKAARLFTSEVDQATADALALAAAQAEADSLLVCTYSNSAQSATAVCPEGQTGDEVTKDVAAGQFTSQDGQEVANNLAKADAQRQANEALVCSGSTVLVSNTPQNGEYSAFCACRRSAPRVITAQATIGPAAYMLAVDNTPAAIQTGQLLVNNQAQVAATNWAYQKWLVLCRIC